jgi:hypothetical protein
MLARFLVVGTAVFALGVPSALADPTQVNLTSSFNVIGIASDGASFAGGGLDGGGYAYSANQLGTARTIGNVPFAFGPANGPSAVANRTIALPAGKFAQLALLATAVNGSQAGQTFKVTYTDASSSTFVQGMSDWYSPEGYAGETTAVTTTRRNASDGSADPRTFVLYQYGFALDASKTVKTLVLPASTNVVVLAATLIGGPGGGTPVVKLFQHCNFGGWAASFTAAGNYATSDLVARGGKDNDASSIQVAAGYKVTLFDGDQQSGNAVVVSAGQTSCLAGNGFNDVLSSLRIEADSGPGPDPGDVDNSVVSCGNAPGGNTSADVPYVRVHKKGNLLKVCVEKSFWDAGGNAAAIRRFFDFFDGIPGELEGLFSFTPTQRPFLIQITNPTGGACACVDPKLGASTGVTVTGDAYPNGYNSPRGLSVPGFWGYLLTLHEFVNVWTGEMTSGWPTDWWADHRSPFPNAMDEEVFRDLGNRQNNQVLRNAATAQHERYTISEPDPQVQMFVRFFDAFGGFAAYNRVFALVRGDGLEWDTVSPSNPSPTRTEYVIAYLQLGFRTTRDLTQSDFVPAGVSRGTEQDAPYTISAANIGDIADAHCSMAAARAAGRSVTTQLNALRHGNFHGARVANAACGAGCPAECGCDAASNQCVAPWRAR